MKLIDILVRELPKRGGWPIESNWCRQFPDGEVCFSNVGKKPDFYTECATDVDLVWRKTVTHHVSREQYEAALAASQKVEWDGVGLPPVGCECEVDYGSVELIDGLSRPDDGDVVRVVSHEKTGFGTQVVVVYWNGVNGGGRAHALIPKCLCPLRTDAERKRDAAVEIMTQILCSPSQASAIAKKIYEAIAAGKIPGVKLED